MHCTMARVHPRTPKQQQAQDPDCGTMDPEHRFLLSFPRPHRLGQSSGVSSSRSFKSESYFIPSSPGQILHNLSEATGGEYSHPPPDKKQKLQLPRAIVETHDSTPLKAFSLFLPPILPVAIQQDAPALEEFVLMTVTTYLCLWKMATKMNYVDIRLPSLYENKLSNNANFLREFINVLFKGLTDVKCINNLYVPIIEFHSTTPLNYILEGLKYGISVSHLYLRLKCCVDEEVMPAYDFKSFASFLHETKLEMITIISTDPLIDEFYEKLAEEVELIETCSLKVTYSNDDLGAPGPEYITAVDAGSSSAEIIEPNLLVHSINAYTEEKVQQKGQTVAKPKANKAVKSKVAISSDCIYFEEAELTSDGPFPSKIWQLERLHQNGIDGSGMTIAILDSGINFVHSAFKNKIVAVKNFVNDDRDNIDCVIDSDGHGTHCAGIAAGSQFYCPINTDLNSECIMIPPGVAPGAKLVICKVVRTSDGDVDCKAFLAALKWLKKIHTESPGGLKIDVVSVSLASTYFSQQRAQIISELTSLGMIIVCCASNVGRLRLQPIAFPARHGQVLCIGAHDENGKPTSFSPVGRELDFLSPGDGIWGPGPGTEGPFSMDCTSGTSCATPAVAGLVCLILQTVTKMCERDPVKYKIGGKLLIELIHNVWVMRELLKEISSSPGHHSDEIGYGTLNPYRLLERSDEEIMRIINDIVEDE